MSKSWLGRIEGITLDWQDGVFVESISAGSVVRYDAKCCLCEWAYSEAKDMELLDSSNLDVGYGYGTPDIEAVLNWMTMHRAEAYHRDAKNAFGIVQLIPVNERLDRREM